MSAERRRSRRNTGAVDKAAKAAKEADQSVALETESPAATKTVAPRRSATFPLGIDYWPMDDEIASFTEWYAGDIEADFAAFAEARLTLVRIFISWKYFEQQVGNYDEEASQRLERLVAAARDNGLQLIVCFFADDRLAELCDVTWGKRRDPRTDPYLIQRQVSLIQRIVSLYRAEKAVFAWDLANEAFCTGFKSAKDLGTWVRTLREAVREVDPERPILLGADPETLLRVSGVDARNAIDECEFAISHVTAPYQAYAAEGPVISGPATYLDSFLLRSARRDLPVLVDGAGVHSLDYSAAQEAGYLRTVLYGSLMNRGAGVLLRRWRDVETERREPYFRDPFEVLVGVKAIDGTPKPALAEVDRFARVAARLDLRRYTPQPERVAVLIPAERYEPLPSLAGLYDPRSCLQAYISAKEAHLPVDIVREGDELGGFSVLLIPSVGRLLQGTWRELTEFVQAGGVLFASYGGGDADPAVRELFGVEFLGDHGSRATLRCRVAQPDALGPLVSFDAKLAVPHFALLGGGGATVIATDAKGSPLLMQHSYGSGRAVYLAAPVERALAQGDTWAAPPAVRAMLRTVYGALSRAAGAALPLACDTPEVEIALFNGEQDDIVLLLNHSPETLTATVTAERLIASIADVRGGQPTSVGSPAFGVPLGPNGAASLRVVWS
ncbi:MAG: cellulase family glycosylhydrolase [Coriobacteriia bacterium]|nr:cellulase family glycosylhydrolase [Coriobacteriia bacterium]